MKKALGRCSFYWWRWGNRTPDLCIANASALPKLSYIRNQFKVQSFKFQVTNANV